MTTGSISVTVPWTGTKKLAIISAGRWSGDAVLERAFRYLHLAAGHHADRDLELAQMAIKFFGGSYTDKRPAPINLHRMPK
jgi:hypothetical protein